MGDEAESLGENGDIPTVSVSLLVSPLRGSANFPFTRGLRPGLTSQPPLRG